jgi:hypothetical protein
LEGGYDIYGQRDSIKEMLKELLASDEASSETNIQTIIKDANPMMVKNVIDKVKKIQGKYWHSIKHMG